MPREKTPKAKKLPPPRSAPVKTPTRAPKKTIATSSAREKPRDEAKSSSSTAADEPGTARGTILASQSVDHCTPSELLEAIVYPVLGRPVDLDPCSNPNSLVRARCALTIDDDGLSKEWDFATIFVNPPYGKGIGQWVRKSIDAMITWAADVIMLVPAYTSSAWFDDVAKHASAVLFYASSVHGRRVKFVGNDSSAAFASCFVYFGHRRQAFVNVARKHGHIWMPDIDQSVAEKRLVWPAMTNDRDDDLLALLRALPEHTSIEAAMTVMTDTMRASLGALSTHVLAAALQRQSRDRRRMKSPVQTLEEVTAARQQSLAYMEDRGVEALSDHIPDPRRMDA